MRIRVFCLVGAAGAALFHGAAIAAPTAANSFAAADALSIQADGLVELDPTKAAYLYKQALELYGDSQDRAVLKSKMITLSQLGNVEVKLNLVATGIASIREGCQIAQRLNDPGSERQLRNDLAFAYHCVNDNAHESQSYELALQAAQRATPRDPAMEGYYANGASLAARLIPDTQRALRFGMLALSLFTADKDKAKAYNSIGLAYERSSQLSEAIDAYKHALALLANEPDKSREGEVNGDLGNAYEELGDYARAIAANKAALAIATATDTSNDVLAEHSLGGLANAEDDMKMHMEALAHYKAALAGAQGAGRADDVVKWLNDIAIVQSELGDAKGALETCRQCLAIGIDPSDKEALGQLKVNEALYAQAIGKRKEAFNLMRDGLALLQTTKNKLEIAQATANAMRFEAFVGNGLVAVFLGKDAINKFQEIRQDLGSAEPEQQGAYIKSVRDAYRELADLLIAQKRYAEAEKVLQLLKETDYFDYIHIDQKLRMRVSQRLPMTAGELRCEKIMSSQSFTTALPRIEAALSGRDKGRDRVRDGSGSAGVEGAIRPGVASITLIVTDRSVDALVLTPGRRSGEIARAAFSTAVDESVLYRKVSSLRAALKNPHLDPRPLAKELYAVVLAPAMRTIETSKAHTLLVSFDDALRYIPVDALMNPRTGRYVAQDYITETVSLGPAYPSGAGMSIRLLAAGVSKARGGQSALPGVAEELKMLVREAGVSSGLIPGHQMIDDTFNQIAFEAQLASHTYPAVHIASHFGLTASETTSYLLLGDGTHLPVSELRKTKNRFGGVELLTLSACDTNEEMAAGNGHEIEGFGALMREMGAKDVVASLWPVSDSATPGLMKAFYAYRVAHPTAPLREALASARNSVRATVLRTAPDGPRRSITTDIVPVVDSVPAPPYAADPAYPYAHPYYWAPFILIGDGR